METESARPPEPSPPSGMVFDSIRRRSPERSERSSSVIGGSTSGMVSRPRLESDVRRGSIPGNNASDAAITRPTFADSKPIASGNGVAIYVQTAEPVLFLQGYDSNDPTSHTTTMLRGSLLVRCTKQAKLKSISLTFKGKSETDWPEGIPPKRVDFKNTTYIMNHTWLFFNAQFPQAEHSYGADAVQLQKGLPSEVKDLGVRGSFFELFQRSSSPAKQPQTSKEMKRLSLRANHSGSSGKDSRLPESCHVDLGYVKYDLEALIERSGAFRANLVGAKGLTLIRAPSEGSLEQTAPIAISRTWQDQLHYDIVISGKSFPLGSSVPIAFKLTPLAKVQCHRINVFVTENIQYFTNNKKVHRLEPTRKMQLIEKRADSTSTSSYPGSSIRVLAGGGVPYDYRGAAASGDENIPHDTTNLLGNLDNDSGSIGSTEMEFNVQLPSCHQMKDKIRSEQLHFDTTYSNIQVNHWIKILMRLSRPDENDLTKRRHFDISIDSPFKIMSCRATQANISLPAYSSGDQTPGAADESECGCPGAQITRRNTPPVLPLPNSGSSAPISPLPQRSWTSDNGGLTMPTEAHVHHGDPNNAASRPMHLLRVPSFNPPAFNEDEPPPPMVTPPPLYENVVNGDTRNALVDYFSRLADEMGDEDDRDDRSRVGYPLTPGGRANRSTGIPRNWIPLGRSNDLTLRSGQRTPTAV
ncbi:hypothetical protein LTR23_010867 [Exophiala sp. CCFEE 6169]|uniref:Arrestin C-terminal-like domain-containing protein n=1 Tax=Vermiconidia calcicola TaxID=1690605 RepID=A0AAV9PTR3_9PEZI|nr:hypothetical protein LTR25_011013 [Vermiconidia calcicola]KAK5529015.1 hypothetical protein LTR23_010867 [Chaetothyriales sp. CCFEE 6169]